jgi:fibronectin type 3 domain-containing protein
MMPFRLARRHYPAAVPGQPATRRARSAAPRGRRLTTVAGMCLAAVLAGWPAVLAGQGLPAGTAAGGEGPAVSVVLTAVREPQARILNPGPPTGLTATAGNGRVTVSWSPPASNGGAAIIGYDLYMGTSSHGESRSPVGGGLIGGTNYTVSGLTNGTTYYFTADAVNDANLHSVVSAEAPATPVTAPGAPRGLTAASADAQVSLSWQAPGSNGGAAITGYRVYQGTSKNPVASVTGTGTTVKNLANGTAYSFKVTAVNKAGEGPASGAASATPAAKVTKPGRPNGLTASPGNGKITLSWKAPGSDGGTGISGYEIYRGTSPGGESGTPVNASLVAGTSFTVTGLTNGTRYYFTVAAVNKAKLQSAKSGEASATPSAGASASASASASGSASATGPATASPSGGATATAAGTPGAPAGLTATPGNGEVGLSWTAPASVGGAPPASYHVYQGTSPGFTLGTPVTSTGDTHATVTGLTNGTTYYFVVTAVDGSGTVSGTSGEASAQPLATAVLASATTTVPKPVIVSLAAVAAVAIAAAGALTARRLRKRPRKRPPAAPPADVRAVPEMGPPSLVNLHEITSHVSAAENASHEGASHEVFLPETYVVRLEPLPAAIITTLEEISG